jgi:hypothetical protein
MVQVQKVSQPLENHQEPDRHKLTPEQFQQEADYLRATIIIRKMLLKGLITEAEFYKIDKLNRQSFSPLLGSIMA